MFIVFESTLETPPEIYETWGGVKRWAEACFGTRSVLSEMEFPIAFKPAWLKDEMLPLNHRADRFACVFMGEEIVGLVFECVNGYGRYTLFGNSSASARKQSERAKLNLAAQKFWARNRHEA